MVDSRKSSCLPTCPSIYQSNYICGSVSPCFPFYCMNGFTWTKAVMDAIMLSLASGRRQSHLRSICSHSRTTQQNQQNKQIDVMHPPKHGCLPLLLDTISPLCTSTEPGPPQTITPLTHMTENHA